MSLLNIPRVSVNDPDKYRVEYEDIKTAFTKGEANYDLPIIKTKSKISIIGGGFGGISVALSCLKKLKEEDFVVFEKHKEFGGTWWANTYPGCASDIPAVWYSFFEEMNSNWSTFRPPQYEMEEYILGVIEKYNIRRNARFHTDIDEARYNDDEGTWTVKGRDVETGQRIEHTSQILVSARGGLVYPNQLNTPGLEKFEGVYMHSAQWNHDVSFKGKKVVVVGNGCSATQVIPALLQEYEPESIVQVVRSKHYIMPPFPSIVQYLYRLFSLTRFTLVFYRFLIASMAEARYPLFKGNGLIARFVRWINTRQSVNYMKKACPKQYQDLVIPEFKIGCKRMIYDKYYLPSLHDPRIDVTDDQIVRIEGNNVILKSGKRIEADIIVACTGYDLRAGFMNCQFFGKNNTNIDELWEKEGVTAYETIMVRDCPNFFLIGGPNSATGHSSVVLAIENGCKYFEILASKILAKKYKTIEVKTKSYYEWFSTIQAELSRAVFGTKFGGCVSWYAEGGVNFTAYPYSQITYWWRMNHPRWSDLDCK